MKEERKSVSKDTSDSSHTQNHGIERRLRSKIEEELLELDPETAEILARPPFRTLTNVYIGGIDTLSWSQDCHSTGDCHSQVWVDTETTVSLFKDEDCNESAGLVAIYNGDRVGDNSALLATATMAYLAKAPVSLHYIESAESYARGHGRLRAVVRLWFSHCNPCGCG